MAPGVADAAAVIMAGQTGAPAGGPGRPAGRGPGRPEGGSRRLSPPLVLSVVAGARVAAISKGLDGLCPVARAMPNTPALVRAGAAALFAAPDGARPVTTAQRDLATRIMQSVGAALWLNDEGLLDAATAVFRQRPGLFFPHHRTVGEHRR